MRSLLVLLVILAGFTGCVRKNKVPVAQQNVASGMHEVKVEDVIQTTNYTYLKVSENGAENWIAVSKQDAAKGDTYYYGQALEMKNFNSKELNRTFETIYFVQGLSKEPIVGNVPTPANQGKVASVKKEGLSVAPAQGSVPIAELYAKAAEYAGKTVKMKGEVVKVNNQVMGKNWVHIQDGTGSENNFDLTVTTQDQAKVGDIVTFEGTIATKKDFGFGYYYDVIMEDARLVK
jgi:hypothetical protein